MTRRLTIFLTVALITATAVATSPFNGWWKGELRQFGLPLVMKICKAEYGDSTRIMLFSPKQSMQGMPSERVVVVDDTLIVDFPSIKANFIGALTHDRNRLSGQFTQQGQSMALDMERSDSTAIKAPRPQTPCPPYPYETQELTFMNDTVELHGTLTIPSTHTGKFPLAIMITGSGTQNRDEEIAGHKPFAVIADALSRNGIATFRYDDRYFNAPSGAAKNATTADFAEDAMSALRALAKKPEIDSKKIGFIGHSEGGTIALLNAASHPDSVAFVISIAGPAYNGVELMTDQNRMLTEALGIPVPETTLNLIKEIFKVAASDMPTHNAKQTIDLMIMTNGSEEIAKLSQQVPEILSPWYRAFLRLDPASFLPMIRCDVLSVAGALDVQVPAEKNKEALLKYLPKATVKIYPGLSHMMQPVRNAVEGLNPHGIETTVDPEVLRDLTEYLKKFIQAF